MAIIVKNINITPRSTEPVVDRSYEISINKFGKVDVGKNGLDLGCQGDHNITKLEFNVNNLNCASELSKYNPVLVFSRKNEDGTITNISCSGTNSVDSPISTFYIPEAVTTEAGDYSIVYTLRETDESYGNVDIPNVTEGNIKEKEVFVSDIFTGKVRSSIYADLVEVVEVENENKEKVPFTTDLLLKLFNKRTEDIKTIDGIYKKKIALTWPEGKGNILINNKEQDAISDEDEDKILGNKYDVFMTYITIDHPFYHEESSKDNKGNEIFVVFISNDDSKVNYAVITMATIYDGLAAVWVPAEVTVSDRKKWKVGFVGLRENEKTGENQKTYLHASYSPAANFILNQNFLDREKKDELDISQSAEVALMSLDGELQTAEEDGTVYTTTVYSARNTTYSLGMSGDDVKTRLVKVNELDSDMTTLKGGSSTPGSIQNSISTLISAHNEAPDAHKGLVRMGTGATGYENYKNKNTVEGIVDVIRSEMTGRVGLTIEDVKDQISIHNQTSDGIHQPIVDKITNTKTELTQEITRVEDLITNKETGLDTRVTSLQEKFDKFDEIYVNESELQEKLNNKVLGFNPTEPAENETYGSYTIKKLKDESDTRLSQINADIASVNVKAEEARTTANQANQTAANAYEAVTTTIQTKADKAELQSLNTKLDTEIAKNTREHEAINKKINDDISTAKIEIDGKITQAVSDAEYSLGLVDDQLKGQINDVKESIKNIGLNENTINTRLSAAETEISSLNIKINGLDNTYATDAALESVKSDLQALQTKESQDITNLENTINTLKGSDIGEDVTISSIDSKVNTFTSDLNTYKGEVNSSIANINTSIGELTSVDGQINTSLNSKLSKTTQIQSLGNVFNSEAEWEAFKASAEETTLYFVLEEE